MDKINQRNDPFGKNKIKNFINALKFKISGGNESLLD
jgi:hypothetical protein